MFFNLFYFIWVMKLMMFNLNLCRGDTPFCSEECRQEQIEIDELKEKNMNLSSSMKGLRIKEQRKTSSSNKDYSFRTGTVIAA